MIEFKFNFRGNNCGFQGFIYHLIILIRQIGFYAQEHIIQSQRSEKSRREVQASGKYRFPAVKLSLLLPAIISNL